MCKKDKQNSERSDRPDEIGSDPVMETLRLFLLRQIVTNLLKMYEEHRKNSERSDRPDEIGSDPNMHMFSRHTRCRAAVVPRRDRSLSLEFFISVPFPFVPCLPPTPTTVPDDFHEMPLSVFVRQDFGRKLTSAVAMSIRVIWRILYGIRQLCNLIVLDHRSYFLSGFLSRIHHTKPSFRSHMKPCFPPHIDHLSHFYHIKPCFPSDEALYQGYEIDQKKKCEEDEIAIWIEEDLYLMEWWTGHEHYQLPEENNISPTCKTKSSDGEAENLNQLLGSIISNHELSQDHNCFLKEDNCSSSTHQDCGILGKNMLSSNDVRFVFPLATESPCSDPPLKQGMVTLSPAVPHVTTSPSLIAPTQSTLMVEDRGAQSLPCSTKSTPQDNLGWLLEEERSVAIINPSMDEKLESTTQCIQTTQLATSSLHLEAFSNGEDNMQLDSSESQSLDATNTGGKVVNADMSCPAISHPEKKNTIGTRKTKRGTVSLADLQQLYHLTRKEAACRLGVSVSTFKRICRDNGISEWGHHNTSKPKLATESVQGAEGTFISPTTSLYTDAVDVGSNYQNSQGSKPPRPQREKKMSCSCNKPSIGGQDEIATQILGNNLSAHKGQLQEQNRFHLQRQEAGNVTIKAKYGEHIVRWPRKQRKKYDQDAQCSKSLESVNAVTAFSKSLEQQGENLSADREQLQEQEVTILKIKATYRDDMVKFDLSSTSGLVELEKELEGRFKLVPDCFKVKYKDEDDEWILIANDKDLLQCVKYFTSTTNKAIRLSVMDRHSGKVGVM